MSVPSWPDFPIPVPARCRDGGKRNWELGAWALAMVGLDDASGVGEGSKALVQGGGADAAAVAQLDEGHGAGDVGKYCGDAVVEGARLHVDARMLEQHFAVRLSHTDRGQGRFLRGTYSSRQARESRSPNAAWPAPAFAGTSFVGKTTRKSVASHRVAS